MLTSPWQNCAVSRTTFIHCSIHRTDSRHGLPLYLDLTIFRCRMRSPSLYTPPSVSAEIVAASYDVTGVPIELPAISAFDCGLGPHLLYDCIVGPVVQPTGGRTGVFDFKTK